MACTTPPVITSRGLAALREAGSGTEHERCMTLLKLAHEQNGSFLAHLVGVENHLRISVVRWLARAAKCTGMRLMAPFAQRIPNKGTQQSAAVKNVSCLSHKVETRSGLIAGKKDSLTSTSCRPSPVRPISCVGLNVVRSTWSHHRALRVVTDTPAGLRSVRCMSPVSPLYVSQVPQLRSSRLRHLPLPQPRPGCFLLSPL